MTFTIDSALGIAAVVNADTVPITIENFKKLSAEDQLSLVWFAYHEISKTFPVNDPTPVSIHLAQPLLYQIKQLAAPEQLQVLRDLANRLDTPICRSYATFTPNVKLGFWYQIGQWMDAGMIASVPRDYRLSQAAIEVLVAIQLLAPSQQMAVLRHVIINMGYDAEEIEHNTPMPNPLTVSATSTKAQSSQVSIDGINHNTVLNYIDGMNANDFAAVADLFAHDGALQPPFQKPIVGKERVLQYLQLECQNLKLLPDKGFVSHQDHRLTRMRVTGQVQTPWFGAQVGLNIAWRFALDADNKISFVAVDLLAPPTALLALAK